MVRTQIRLSEAEAEAVRLLAARRGVSMAAVIRAAVEQYVEREAEESAAQRWARSLGAIGGFHSGTADLSARHDDEFADAAGA
jgi:predicted transcriptional regulator